MKQGSGKPFVIPIAFAIGIIPFIMRVHLYSTAQLAGYPWFVNTGGAAVDVFLAYKSFVLQFLIPVLLIMLVIYRFLLKRPLSFNRYLILPGVYLTFVIISGITSEHSFSAFSGSYERFEPVGVIAAYILLFYYAFFIVSDEKTVKFLIAVAAVPVSIMILIGCGQGLGLDIFSLDPVKRLLIPADLT